MRLLAMILAAIMLAGVACAPPAPQPAPPKPAQQPAPKPEPAQPAAPKQEAQPAQPDWEAEWEQVLEAARQEGTVVVAGPASADANEVLTRPFQEEYGITVDYFGASQRELVPRVASEREAGQYVWDVVVQGALDTGLLPMGALAPMEPALILPEVTDQSNWRGGEIEYLDPDRSIIVMTPFQRGTVFVNPDIVDPAEITSYRDLLDPRFRGQIVIDDPRRTGPGQATFTFFYLHPDLGPDFIRELAQQEPTILRDYQQEVDLVARGSALVLVGTADFIAEARMNQGVPIAIVDPRQIAEGSDVSPANGTVALFDRQPNPNAARVYVNWLLSQEGQTAFSQALGYVSSRVDVPTDHALPWRVPQPDAIKTYLMEVREREAKEILSFYTEVFGEP